MQLYHAGWYAMYEVYSVISRLTRMFVLLCSLVQAGLPLLDWIVSQSSLTLPCDFVILTSLQWQNRVSAALPMILLILLVTCMLLESTLG